MRFRLLCVHNFSFTRKHISHIGNAFTHTPAHTMHFYKLIQMYIHTTHTHTHRIVTPHTTHRLHTSHVRRHEHTLAHTHTRAQTHHPPTVTLLTPCDHTHAPHTSYTLMLCSYRLHIVYFSYMTLKYSYLMYQKLFQSGLRRLETSLI